MMSTHLLLTLLLALPHLATAQSSQTILPSIPFLGYDISPTSGPAIDASIIAISDSTTTMALACAPGTDASACGLAPAQALIYGPSTYLMALSEADAFTFTQDCVFAAATAGPATCMEFATGSEANYPGSSTTTYAATEVQFVPVTVTAGEELLAGGSGTASATAGGVVASSSSGALTTLTGVGSATTATATSGMTSTTGTSTASVGAASASSTGAAGAVLATDLGGVTGAIFGLLGYFVL